MKIAFAFAGLFIGIVVSGCTHHQGGTTSVQMGPTIFGGVTNYPAHPGAVYYNSPVDYTTNPPPPGVVPLVTVYSTNSHIAIRMIDGSSLNGVGTVIQ